MAPILFFLRGITLDLPSKNSHVFCAELKIHLLILRSQNNDFFFFLQTQNNQFKLILFNNINQHF